MFNKIKANKIFKYLKQHNFQLNSMPAKIRNMLSDDNVLKIINSKLDFNKQIFRKSDLFIADLYLVKDVKIVEYRSVFNFSYKVNYDFVGIKVLQKLSKDDDYYDDKYFIINDGITFENNQKQPIVIKQKI